MTPAIDRFLAKVDSSSGRDACHPWTASRSVSGYGYFVVSASERTYAHRWLLGFLRGETLRQGEMALHRCDNPPCVNPRHLYVGDHKQNMRDCVERGRNNTEGLAKGREPGRHLGRYRTGPELCGSMRGYSRRLRLRETPCAPCRAAIVAYNHERRMARSS